MYQELEKRPDNRARIVSSETVQSRVIKVEHEGTRFIFEISSVEDAYGNANNTQVIIVSSEGQEIGDEAVHLFTVQGKRTSVGEGFDEETYGTLLENVRKQYVAIIGNPKVVTEVFK